MKWELRGSEGKLAHGSSRKSRVTANKTLQHLRTFPFLATVPSSITSNPPSPDPIIHQPSMAPHQTPTALQDEERSTGTSPDPSTSSHQLTSPMQQPESRTGNKPSRVDRSDRLCFFYGSLMDSGHIASVLDLAKEPDLRPARIHGYRTMQKGPFPPWCAQTIQPCPAWSTGWMVRQM